MKILEKHLKSDKFNPLMLLFNYLKRFEVV